MTGKVREFTRKDPELNRKLVQLEDNMFALFQTSTDSRRLEVVAPIDRAGTVVRPGQLARVQKQIEVLLPAPTLDTAGLSLVVWNRSGGTVTVRPIKGTINAIAFASLTGARAYRMQHDGVNYVGEF